MISYAPLWETMRRKNISQYALIHIYHISPAQITRLKRNESVSTHTIDTFCNILDCKVEDVMEHIKQRTTDRPNRVALQ
ncbi:MAG: helix-turn-helix transcriptional regulator [Clostridia bacterium]|nr:helix-turn-helix transcriptional regulator [Clostridia bacterium]